MSAGKRAKQKNNLIKERRRDKRFCIEGHEQGLRANSRKEWRLPKYVQI